MASANIAVPPTPLEGHVHLVLFERRPDSFYLEIPLHVIRNVCRHPPKYLQYFGWCVLGVEGSLQDGRGHLVNLNSELVDMDIYHYRLPAAQDVLSHAVDLEVIKLRSQVSSQSGAREAFRQDLATRDGEQCVWTGLPPGVGMHIIPLSKGDEWFQLIIANRPHGNETRLDTLKSINDIRNGIMSNGSLHTPYFDSRAAVVLKTPNQILQTNDIPDRRIRNLPDGTSYPASSRYTLQWLATDNQFLLAAFPNNTDAAFVSHHKPKPSDLLLHYNYGAAAVKYWGRNQDALSHRPGLPRPQVPETVAMDATKSVGDRTTTIAKLVDVRDIQQQPAGNGGGTGSAAATNSEQPAWDEDDVMLFFWGNSMPSVERHAKKDLENKDNINKWRAGTAM